MDDSPLKICKVKGCLPQNLLSPLLNYLSQIYHSVNV